MSFSVSILHSSGNLRRNGNSQFFLPKFFSKNAASEKNLRQWSHHKSTGDVVELTIPYDPSLVVDVVYSRHGPSSTSDKTVQVIVTKNIIKSDKPSSQDQELDLKVVPD
jgi:hypothetical protein